MQLVWFSKGHFFEKIFFFFVFKCLVEDDVGNVFNGNASNGSVKALVFEDDSVELVEGLVVEFGVSCNVFYARVDGERCEGLRVVERGLCMVFDLVVCEGVINVFSFNNFVAINWLELRGANDL